MDLGQRVTKVYVCNQSVDIKKLRVCGAFLYMAVGTVCGDNSQRINPNADLQ